MSKSHSVQIASAVLGDVTRRKKRLLVLHAVLGAAALLVIASGGLAAESTGAIYGKGVHAYFAGDLDQALEYLGATVDEGTTDPRCWYFRGLTLLRLGREDEARKDFEKGAKCELAATYQVYRVGKALERVQGHDRLILEEHRSKARLAAYEKDEKARRARYEAYKNQSEILLPEQDEPRPVRRGRNGKRGRDGETGGYGRPEDDSKDDSEGGSGETGRETGDPGPRSGCRKTRGGEASGG